jgi:hypothetical protein
MSTAGRKRRDSSTGTGVIKKTPFVNSAQRSVVTARARAATFVQDEDMSSSSKAKKLVGTQNAVTRTKLRSGQPPLVGTDRTVFFKAHNDANAASQYAVASTRMARFLDMPDVIAENAFGQHNGVAGVVAGRISGVPVVANEFKKERELPDKSMSKKEIDDWVKSSQLVRRGGKIYGRSAQVQQYVDYTDPRIQKGMSDLQLFDAITGQLDRHGGNIYVDPATGKVTGIDDDKSFGNGKAVAAITDRDPKATHYRGLPEQVDEATALDILSKDPQELWTVLAPKSSDGKPLSNGEINDARRRLMAVQSYLRDLRDNGKLVKVWNAQTYQKTMQYPNRSYLGVAADALATAFEGHVDNPGQFNEVRYKVAGAPKTLPQLPARLPTWTAPRPGQQAQPGQQPQPGQTILASRRAQARGPVQTTTQTTTNSPSTAATTRVLAEQGDMLPTIGDDSADSTDSAESFGERTLVTLSGGDEVFVEDDDELSAESDDEPVTQPDDSEEGEKTDRGETDEGQDNSVDARIARLEALLDYIVNKQ